MSSFISIQSLENHCMGIVLLHSSITFHYNPLNPVHRGDVFYLMYFNLLKWGDFAFPCTDENG